MIARFIAIISAIATLSFAPAASAADCNKSAEKHHVFLDWTRGASGQALTTQPLRVVGENCDSKAKDKATAYYFEALFGDKSFASKEDITKRIELAKSTRELRQMMTTGEIDKAIAGLDKTDREWSAAQADAGKTVVEIKKPEIVTVGQPKR